MVNRWEYMLLAGKGLDAEQLLDKLNELARKDGKSLRTSAMRWSIRSFSSARGRPRGSSAGRATELPRG